MSNKLKYNLLLLLLVLIGVANSENQDGEVPKTWKISDFAKSLENFYLDCKSEPHPLKKIPYCIIGDLLLDVEWDRAKEMAKNLEKNLIEKIHKTYDPDADLGSCPASGSQQFQPYSENEVQLFLSSLGGLARMPEFCSSKLQLNITNIDKVLLPNLDTYFSRNFEVNNGIDCKSDSCVQIGDKWAGFHNIHASLTFESLNGITTSILTELSYKWGNILAIEGNVFDGGISLKGRLAFFEIMPEFDKSDALFEIIEVSKTLQNLEIEKIHLGREGDITSDGITINRVSKQQGSIPIKSHFRKFLVLQTRNVLVGFVKSKFTKCKLLGEVTFANYEYAHLLNSPTPIFNKFWTFLGF